MIIKRVIICVLVAVLCLAAVSCNSSSDANTTREPFFMEATDTPPAEENGEDTDTSDGGSESRIAANIDTRLVGKWDFDAGTWIWFFGTSSVVEFFEDGTVTQVDTYDTGEWEVASSGKMEVNDSQGGTFAFDYELNEDSLTIIDSDGDRAVWIREGGSRPPQINEEPGEIDTALIGRWEFVDGPFLYFFAQDSDIEFFADGRIREHAHNETGTWHIDVPNGLVVVGEWTGRNEFTYMLSGDNLDTLTITDEANDSAEWRRAEVVAQG